VTADSVTYSGVCDRECQRVLHRFRYEEIFLWTALGAAALGLLACAFARRPLLWTARALGLGCLAWVGYLALELSA
jgi:hypothetical protein